MRSHLWCAFEEMVMAEGFDLRPLSAMHAIRAGSYGSEHRDPFDRMFAAQAIIERRAGGSVNEALEALDADRVW
jgi:PIN domain nuclease of toxin-antitoxin system